MKNARRKSKESNPQTQAAATIVNVSQSNTTNVNGRQFNPLIAALLSLIIPGLGQLYKGQPISAIVWFIAVVIGYLAFILPGVILHIFCIIGAAMGARR